MSKKDKKAKLGKCEVACDKVYVNMETLSDNIEHLENAIYDLIDKLKYVSKNLDREKSKELTTRREELSPLSNDILTINDRVNGCLTDLDFIINNLDL